MPFDHAVYSSTMAYARHHITTFADFASCRYGRFDERRHAGSSHAARKPSELAAAGTTSPHYYERVSGPMQVRLRHHISAIWRYRIVMTVRRRANIWPLDF